MKKLWCDFCGKEIGGVITIQSYYVDEPNFNQFYLSNHNQKEKDICIECNNELTKIIHETINKLKEKRKEKDGKDN